MNDFESKDTKNIIRAEILAQFIQICESVFINGDSKIVINSLPGENWRWETAMVYNASFHPRLNFEFNCFEWKRAIFRKGSAFPSGQFRNVKINYTKDNFSFSPECKALQFIWADYCGTPLTSTVKDFQAAIKPGNIVYLTFTTKWRFKDWRQKINSTIMSRVNAGDSNANAVINGLENLIKAKVGNKFTRIFHVEYIGGKNSPMITIGWDFVMGSTIMPFCPGFIAKSKTKVIKIKKTGQKKGLTATEKNQLIDLINTGITNAEIIAQSKFTEYQIRGVKAYISRITREKSQSQGATNQ